MVVLRDVSLKSHVRADARSSKVVFAQRAIMSRTRLICISSCFWIASIGVSWGATIPAGTALVARTLGVISSHAKPGGVFMAKLEHNVVVNGKAVLPADTRVVGVVEASRGDRFRTSPLIL